jgi:iron complex outermembrane receptor protein
MALLGSSHAWAANGDLLSLPLEELAQLDIRVATGTPTPLSAAPAATALLLPADFRAMGAQTVQEALVAVPGLQVSPYSGISGSDRYFLRGISSGTSVQTLILVNGLPMALQGSSAQTPMLKAPIELIERIEVIRGPGSALYGADAFAGVINIITRDAAALQGGEAGARVGSFDTGTAYLAGGGTVGEAQAGVLLSWSGTQGDDRFIPIDVQTLNDIRDGTSASLAPGPVPQGAQRTDLYATLRRGDVSAAFYWNEVWDFDVGQGLAGALDPQGEVGGRHVDGNIRWQRDGVGAWNLEARLSWLHNATRSIEPFRTLPPGAFGNDPATGQPLFPEGLLDDVDQAENDSMLQASALWQGWDKHRLRLGAGATYADFYKSRHRNNYFFSPASPAPLPRSGGLTDISDTPATIVPESDRTGLFVFAQDEWQLAPAWQLTTGLRYDHFSDFGDALTPRLALVWQTTPKFTSKLIYGEAFRAPAFNELYATGNPFALGNRNLEPERLQSMELGFGYRPGTHWNLGLHLYQFEIRDFIDFLPVGGGPALMAQNASHYRGRGVEAEATYRQGRFELRGNVSAQEVKNKDSNDDLGSAPNHQAYLRAGVDLGAQWQAAAQWRHVGSRERQPGDPQAKLEGYTGLDLTLRRAFDARAEVYLVGRNVTDEDQREPGISPVPESIPLPGRSVMVGARVNW